MALVHTWSGLLVGWVLFFVFLTGTFGYLNTEVTRWMKPEIRSAAALPPAAELLPAGQDRLAREARDAQSWYIFFPGGRSGSAFSVGWRTWPDGDARFGAFRSQALDPASGRATVGTVRETGGGDTLYRMHYRLHYMPYDLAVAIVGICSMFMLVAILTGVIVHKKIFRDFFTFRSGKGQRSWLDGHNLLSVTALPFHVMITWSGLIFYMFTYIPAAVDSFYPEGEARDRFHTEVLGSDRIAPGTKGPIAGMAPLGPMLALAESRWGQNQTATIRIESPGRANAQVLVYSHDTGIRRARQTLLFDGNSGRLLNEGPKAGTATGRFEQVMLGLHEGRFAGPVLRALYVFAGLAGTAMIATGLVLWSSKRKAKPTRDGDRHVGIAAVDILNAGTIIGLPIGIAVYFWANRLLPVGMDDRAAWEVHAMFIAWGLTYLLAMWRPASRVWLELCALAAAACGLLPVVNALTTDRGLGASIAEGDWGFAGFDLSALGAGLFFIFLFRLIRRKDRQRAAMHAPMSAEAAKAKAA